MDDQLLAKVLRPSSETGRWLSLTRQVAPSMPHTVKVIQTEAANPLQSPSADSVSKLYLNVPTLLAWSFCFPLLQGLFGLSQRQTPIELPEVESRKQKQASWLGLSQRQTPVALPQTECWRRKQVGLLSLSQGPQLLCFLSSPCLHPSTDRLNRVC